MSGAFWLMGRGSSTWRQRQRPCGGGGNCVVALLQAARMHAAQCRLMCCGFPFPACLQLHYRLPPPPLFERALPNAGALCRGEGPPCLLHTGTAGVAASRLALSGVVGAESRYLGQEFWVKHFWSSISCATAATCPSLAGGCARAGEQLSIEVAADAGAVQGGVHRLQRLSAVHRPGR